MKQIRPGRRVAGSAVVMPRESHTPGAAMIPTDAWFEIGCSLKLSGREIQIVRAIFDDETETAIASELRISRRTVHTHVERLYRKLDVKDRVELVLRITNEFLTLTASPGSGLPSICANRAAGRCPLQPKRLNSATS